MDEVEAGTIYITADGYVAYAIVPSTLMLFNDPSASIIQLSRPDEARIQRRFPLIRMPGQTTVSIIQGDRQL